MEIQDFLNLEINTYFVTQTKRLRIFPKSKKLMHVCGSRFHIFRENDMLNHVYKEYIYKQTGKLHFTTKYNFHQNKMAMVLHDIKIGHCMLPTLTIFN